MLNRLSLFPPDATELAPSSYADAEEEAKDDDASCLRMTPRTAFPRPHDGEGMDDVMMDDVMALRAQAEEARIIIRFIVPTS